MTLITWVYEPLVLHFSWVSTPSHNLTSKDSFLPSLTCISLHGFRMVFDCRRTRRGLNIEHPEITCVLDWHKKYKTWFQIRSQVKCKKRSTKTLSVRRKETYLFFFLRKVYMKIIQNVFSRGLLAVSQISFDLEVAWPAYEHVTQKTTWLKTQFPGY